MLSSDIIDWCHQEFQPVDLATPDDTIGQLIRNAIRYWNTHSAFPVVKMFPISIAVPGSGNLNATTVLSSDYKNVVKVYPATQPDWILQNYPLWSLLGITIIDNLTSDLIMLTEAYKNYRYYMGTDFNWHYEKSDDPAIGGTLYMSNLPNRTGIVCVVGTKRIINGTTTLNIIGTSGTFSFIPVEGGTIVMTNGTHTYTDDGNNNLVSSISGYSGTVDYSTGAWTVTGWVGAVTGTVTYRYEENIKSEYILEWLLYYIKALLKMAEGNTLRKTTAIGIANDGAALYIEGKEEKEALEEKLGIDGRWFAFVKRF